MVLLIGIGGVTCSGKTSVSNELVSARFEKKKRKEKK